MATDNTTRADRPLADQQPVRVSLPGERMPTGLLEKLTPNSLFETLHAAWKTGNIACAMQARAEILRRTEAESQRWPYALNEDGDEGDDGE